MSVHPWKFNIKLLSLSLPDKAWVKFISAVSEKATPPWQSRTTCSNSSMFVKPRHTVRRLWTVTDGPSIANEMRAALTAFSFAMLSPKRVSALSDIYLQPWKFKSKRRRPFSIGAWSSLLLFFAFLPFLLSATRSFSGTLPGRRTVLSLSVSGSALSFSEAPSALSDTAAKLTKSSASASTASSATRSHKATSNPISSNVSTCLCKAVHKATMALSVM
mmetsp:Transcript_42698/g.129005  ORF Transcript_42698/g.129005 Transcript_42698/m.129005 type:complete len:218 (-) Transcript_42698:259-912(-)